MVHRTYQLLVGCLVFTQGAALVLAEDEIVDGFRAIVPPAPTASAEPVPQTAANEPVIKSAPAASPAAKVVIEPLPLEIKNQAEPVETISVPSPSVPSPSDPPSNPAEQPQIIAPAPIEVPAVQEAPLLQVETVAPKEFAEFSTARWRPGVSSTHWMPGHRDRFGILSFTGESMSVWENWGGLASTSGTGFHFLNGPVRTDLPSKVFDFTWGLAWNGEMMPGLSASLSGKVGLYTDFEDSVRDGWRFPAHAILFHDWTRTVQGVAGVQYLDRENLAALPVLGVILRPDDRVRVEAVFPEPRLAWRVHADEDAQHWLSVSGQIGGGEWAIERSNTDLADVVTYNEYSGVLGFHVNSPNDHQQAFEIGYTFARDLEYRSQVGNYQPEDTLFFRLSSRY